MINLLFFSGSSKKGSVNTRLAHAAADLTKAAFSNEATVILIDLSDYDMPTFDGEVATEENFPDNARKLKSLLAKSDGVFMGSDEYTGAYSALFRNIIGWLTLDTGDGAPIFKGKTIALCGASPRGVGGLRGHPALHQLLTVIGASVIPQQISLGTSASAFDREGQLLPRVKKQLLEGSIPNLVQAAAIQKASST